MSKKYDAVKGKLPTTRDLPDWGELKFLQFLRFLDYWEVDGAFKVTIETVGNMQVRSLDEPFWEEFMARINMPMGRADFTPRKFSMRLYTFSRVPLAWLKKNPHAVTPEMYELMKKSKRTDWAADAFKVVKNEIGADVVVLNQDETTDPSQPHHMPDVTDIKTPMALYDQSLYLLATVATQLLKGITYEDIKKMSPKERIMLANNILPHLGKHFAPGKPNVVVFQKINQHAAGREELESKITEYMNTQV